MKFATDVTEMAKCSNRKRPGFSSMMEQAPINVMFADREFKIRYVNPASVKTLKTLEHLLPIKADQLVGQSIDIFHKRPEHQRKLLADPKQPAAPREHSGRSGNARPAGQPDLRPEQDLSRCRWSPGKSSPQKLKIGARHQGERRARTSRRAAEKWPRFSTRSTPMRHDAGLVGRRTDRRQHADGGQRRRDLGPGQRRFGRVASRSARTCRPSRPASRR